MKVPVSLRIHYAGPPEIIHNNIDPAQLLVDVVYDDKSYRKLISDEYIILPYEEIKNTQKNAFMLQYTENQITISKVFFVQATTDVKFKNKELCVKYLTKEGMQNVSAYFSIILYEPLLDQVVFDFMKFASHAWDGKYQVTIPITKNIQSRFPGEWLIEVKNHGYNAYQINQYRIEKENQDG